MYNSEIYKYETSQKTELEKILTNSKMVTIEKILNYSIIKNKLLENDKNALQYFTDTNIDKMINFCLGENKDNLKKKEFCKIAFNSVEILSSGSNIIIDYFLQDFDYGKTREDSFLDLNEDNFREKKKNCFFGSSDGSENEESSCNYLDLNYSEKKNRIFKKNSFQKSDRVFSDNKSNICSSKSFSNFKTKKKYKLPNLEKLFKIFENPEKLNSTIISYIQKILNSLINKKSYKIITYLYKKKIIDKLLKYCKDFDSINLIIEKLVNIHYDEETLNFGNILDERKIIYEKILDFILDVENKEIFGLSNIFIKLYTDKSYILDSEYFLEIIFYRKEIILEIIKKIKITRNLELCDFIIFYFEKIYLLKKKKVRKQESISKIIDSENSDIVEDIFFPIVIKRIPSLDSKIRNLKFTIENELCSDNLTLTDYEKKSLIKKIDEEIKFFGILKKIILEIYDVIFDFKVVKKIIQSDGIIENGIFYYKIKLFKILRKISESDSDDIIEFIIKEDFFVNILEIFFLYPKNNILHFEIMKILENIIFFLIENFETKIFENYFYSFLDYFTNDFFKRIKKIIIEKKNKKLYFLAFFDKLSIFINSKIILIKYIFYNENWHNFKKNYLQEKLSEEKFLISNPNNLISKKSSLNIDPNYFSPNHDKIKKKKNSILFQNFSSSDEEEILEENDSGIFKESTKLYINEDISDDDIDNDIELVKRNLEHFKLGRE